MAYDNTNKGTLGKNKERDSENPEHAKWPEYKGKINVDGKDYWLSGWVKENKENGEKFFSLSVTEKKAKGEKEEPKAAPAAELDSDIPFDVYERGTVI